MTSQRILAGVAHDIAHHASSGLSFLSPHMAHALRSAGLPTVTMELLTDDPYPTGVPRIEPLRAALATLRETAEKIVERNGFSIANLRSISFSATPAPWDEKGYTLHTRVVVTSHDGREFDSGWIG